MEALLATFAPGTVLGGRFEIVGELGAGGSATVYLALDKTRQERVALKVLHPHLAGDADNARRLLREVRAASALQHPRALLPYDMHELDGLYALSLPVHDGVSLGEHVQIHGPWTADALERLTLQLCDVLAAAHRRGLLHRDLSPGNVMIDSDGDAMLTDFGLARVAGHQTSTATRAMGTPGFTAPEVYEGRTADPRSDLYGLGGVIYMAATGTRPFSAPSPVGVLKKQLDGQHLRLEEARPDLPRVLSTTIDALLSPVPEARPHSASDVVARLSGEPVRAPEPAAPRRTGPVVLPSGTHGVVVRERSNQEGRRQAMRLRRKDEHDLGEMFTLGFHHAAEQARRWMRTALELPGALPPEERLRDAVAAAAGLPSAALELPDALLDTRFTLVADVDAGTAAGLAEAARRAGFHARAQQQTSPSDSRLPIAAGAAAFLVAALIGISIASQAVSIAAVLALGVLVLILVLGAWVLDRQLLLMSPVREPLRVAYGRDLAPHLTPAHRPLAAAPRAADPTEEHVGDQVLALLLRLRSGIDAAAHLPSLHRSDLTATVDRLSEQATELRRELAILDQHAAQLAPTHELEEVVSRLKSRLARLETLGKGQAERTPLEASLATHRQAMDRADDLEASQVRATAHLLEIRAAAQQLLGRLRGPTDHTQQLGDTLARLQRDLEASRAAEAELKRSAASRASAAKHHRQ